MKKILHAVLSLHLVAAAASAATIGWDQTGAGPWDYNTAGNWVGGDINGIWDASLTLDAAQTVTFASDTPLSTGLSFSHVGPSVTFRGTGGNRLLTLGGDINVNTATNQTINFGSSTTDQGLAIDLGGVVRTFTVASGRTLGFVNAISNGGVTIYGGTVNMSGLNTYSGATTLNTGALSLNGSQGSISNSDLTITGVGATTFNSGTGGVTGTTRAKSVTLNGIGGTILGTARLSVTGNSGANSVDSITGALTAGSGLSIVALAPNASRNAQLSADSFVRNAGAMVLLRGANLGVNTSASQTANSSNIIFANSPTLVGGGGAAGSTTISILPGAFGDSTSTGTGFGATGGLVTYDSAKGVRLLDYATEYTSAVVDGQTQLDNVRYVNSSGTQITTTLTSAITTINSLSINLSGTAGNQGVTITGGAGTTLRVNSGVIFANNSLVTGSVTSTDAMTISVETLDLNGREGVIIAANTGINNGNTSAPLQINSGIANDGGNGVTVGGNGQVIFGGSALHTYTGVTTLNSGVLRLAKTVQNSGIAGDLVMNGGTLLKNSEAIPNAANVTINGGMLWFDTTTSSGNNGHSETINNFTMNGGAVGHHGSNNTFNINGNATINASELKMNAGGDITVLGTTTLNGGLMTVSASSSASSVNALFSLNDLAINNIAKDAYTPIVLNGSSSNLGGRLILNGDLTFTGNGTNSNTATINSSDTGLTNQGVIALNGTRTFNIGNGAATVDLAIVPAMTNNGATVGGLNKTGAGTLELRGANTYTGATTVTAGTLLINGSLTGSTVALNGGSLGGSGTIAGVVTTGGASAHLAPGNSPGTLTLSGGLDASLGVTFDFELGTSSDLLDLGSGTFTGSLSANDLVFNFSDSGGLLAGNPYTLVTFGLATGLDYTDLMANIMPSGYMLDGSFGTGGFLINGSNLQVQFTAVPEPSVGLLMLAGIASLLAFRRMKTRRVILT